MGPRSRRERNGNKTRAGPRSPAAATVRPSVRSPARRTNTSRRPSASGNSPSSGCRTGSGSGSRSGLRQNRGGAQAQRGETRDTAAPPHELRLPAARAAPEGPEPLSLSRRRLCAGTVCAGLSRGSSRALPGPTGAEPGQAVCAGGAARAVRVEGARGGGGVVAPGAHCEGGGAERRQRLGQGDSGVGSVAFFPS